jgi:phenylpropionate dioxygenase-like ring-hydroxylating dioxygenase large terminal subunit
MIPNQWYVVMDSSEVRDRPVGVTRMGEKLVFWRDGAGKVSCLRDKCAHRGVQLSKGKMVGGRLQCPFHGMEYDATGRVRVIPANGKKTPVPEQFRVHGYPTHEAREFIWIWWGETPPESPSPPPFFEDIDDGFVYTRFYDRWNAHYSRVIENQLDVAHLPFVHHNTIGRGGRTLVDGPGLQWKSERMFFIYVYDRRDDGTPPRKPSEVPVPDPPRGFRLEFILPNLWQNYIADKMRIVAAFVPVDQERTILYLRTYQKLMRLPLLRNAVGSMLVCYSRVIAHQDRRVVVTQEPKASGLRIGENLIQADHPILAYRQRRDELLKAAGAGGQGGRLP